MASLPGPYSGTSTLALVARVSAFSFGLVYGSVKLKVHKLPKLLGNDSITISDDVFKAKAKSHKKAEAKGHH